MGGTGKTALMKAWLDALAADSWRGADAVYTWSFYSQGSAEDRPPSAHEFFADALAYFGHDGSPIRSDHDRGRVLAELVCRQRTLLVLDGLEPLQHPPGPLNGELRDKGLRSLFLQLAASGGGLLLISSRQPVPELAGKPKPVVLAHPLEQLSIEAGVELFRAAGICGEDKELTDTVKNYDGHALSLSLLAFYLTEYESGDIIQQYKLRSLTEFPESTYQSRHAFKVMAAYERKLADTPELHLLYRLGLFDRPASAKAMACLREADISHISDSPMIAQVFRAVCKRLRRQHLLNVAAQEDQNKPEEEQKLDTHPLVRQYFGRRLAELHPESWRQAHLQLYEYFKALPEKELPDTLEEMEPLFAAVRHGSAAGLHKKAMEEVYWPKILRQNKHYIAYKFGAFAADLAVVAHFFAVPWHTPAAGLTDAEKAAVLNSAATRLRALGRLSEAARPMQAGLNMRIQQEDWKEAAADASNLSELFLAIGEIAQAVAAGQQSVDLADRSGEACECLVKRTILADALHQAGKLVEASALFVEAERMQQERHQTYDQLYSLPGVRCCDLLLAGGAWQKVRGRAEKTLQWAKQYGGLLTNAFEKRSLGRAALQEAIAQAGLLVASGLAPDLACVSLPINIVEPDSHVIETMYRAKNWLDQAVAGLREAGTEDHLPRGLLARAACCRWAIVLLGQPDSIAQAVQDLHETEDIAQRGGMRLHMIDFHLEAARLALAAGQDILSRTASQHLAAAKQGIAETGYKRRLPEAEQMQCQINPFAARQNPFSVKQQTSADR